MPLHISSDGIESRYRLTEKLGEGGMGAVYRAFDRLTRQPVALKRVHVPTEALQFATTDSDPTLALALEFRTLAGLRHPHIIAVLDYGFDDQRRPFYTMHLIEHARTLIDYGTPLDSAGRVRLLIEMLQALVYLHRRGILHRDLKPANVLVTPDGAVKVMDFGLALQHDASQQFHSGLAGTLAYMAPELFSDQAPSIASDLYTVGVMMVELYTGRHPFAGGSMSSLLTQILTRDADLALLPDPLVPLAAQLLSKDPQKRPQQAEAVIAALCAATNTPPPIESSALRESFLQASSFVGRETELATLRAALKDAMQGTPRFWLVGGESGVGKSRLLDELRTRALLSGVLVLRGQAVAEGGLPYQPWREIVRRLALETPLSDLEAGVLKPLAPDLPALLEREVPDAPELAGEAGQRRMVLTLVDLLRRLDRPVVLLLEDLQWAEDSLTPLRELLRTADLQRPLLVVGTYRDDEKPDLPKMLEGMSVLRLTRLSAEAIARLAQSMLGTAGEQPAVVDLLQRETEGNAFFMVETVRTLAEDAGALAAVGRNTLPPSVLAGGVQRLLQQRLNRLAAPVRDWLNYAAVIGRQLDLPVLHQVSIHHFSQDVPTVSAEEMRPLPSLIAAGVLTAVADELLTLCANAAVLELFDGQWRFSHDKIREQILRDLPTGEMQRVSRRVAEAIEAVYPGQPHHYGRIADLYGAAGLQMAQARYLRLALMHNLEVGAYNAAAMFGERAHALMIAAGADPEDDPELMVCIAQAKTGQRRWAEAIALLENLHGWSTRHGDDRIRSMVTSRQGYLQILNGRYDRARELLNESLDAALRINYRDNLGPIHVLQARIARGEGAFDRAEALYVQAVAECAASNNLPMVCEALVGLGWLSFFRGDSNASRHYLNQGLEITRRIGNRDIEANILGLLGVVYMLAEDYVAAEPWVIDGLGLSRSNGDVWGTAWGHHCLGDVCWMLERYSEALEQYQLAEALYRSFDNTIGQVFSIGGRGNVYTRLGQTEQARHLLKQALELAVTQPEVMFTMWALIGVAEWYIACGDAGQAAPLLRLVLGNPTTQQWHRARALRVADQLADPVRQIALPNTAREAPLTQTAPDLLAVVQIALRDLGASDT